MQTDSVKIDFGEVIEQNTKLAECFESLKLPIPENVSTYSYESQQFIYRYLSSLNDVQRKAYMIAKDHLGTSFHILRSTGYTDWKKKV